MARALTVANEHVSEAVHGSPAKAAIKALADAGFVIVPREPDAAMIEAGRLEAVDMGYEDLYTCGKSAVRHVIKAATTTAQGDGE